MHWAIRPYNYIGGRPVPGVIIKSLKLIQCFVLFQLTYIMIRIISFGMYRDMYRIVTPVYRFTPRKDKQKWDILLKAGHLASMIVDCCCFYRGFQSLQTGAGLAHACPSHQIDIGGPPCTAKSCTTGECFPLILTQIQYLCYLGLIEILARQD